MTFPAYPEYKDSGVEWLGDVPSHWAIQRADSFIETHRKTMDADTISRFQVFHYSIPNIQETGNGRLEDGQTIDSNKLIIEERQILVSKLNPRKGTCCIAKPNIEADVTLCSTELVPLIPKRTHFSFLFRVIQTEEYRCRLESLVESVTRSHQRVLPESIFKFAWAFPPLEEQSAIAAFLDHETAKIDALITEQEKLIELLKEKRQAVISHAVTKGLDPNVPMKDSGVEWLGEVPEHWRIVPLKIVASILYGLSQPPAYKDSGIPFIRATNVHFGNISDIDMVFVDPNDISSQRITWLFDGDIIVVRSGAYTGDSAIVRSSHCPSIAGFDMVVRSRICNPYFLQLSLLSIYMKNWQIDLAKTRAAQPHLNAEELGACMFLMPPEDEQQNIVQELLVQCSKIDELTETAQRAIDLLKERRSALISAAVTGKIDVRGFAPVSEAV